MVECIDILKHFLQAAPSLAENFNRIYAKAEEYSRLFTSIKSLQTYEIIVGQFHSESALRRVTSLGNIIN